MPITVLILSTGDPSGERTGPPQGRADGHDAAPASLTFDGMQRIVIGRGLGSDVRLPDPSVSHRHATIRAQGNDFVVVDEGSTNGTFVGEVRIAPLTSRLVRPGDRVRVGRLWLEIRVEAGPVTRDVALATRDLALALVARALEARGDDTTMRLRVVEGPDQGASVPLAVEGQEILVGRGPHCDLLLADADASREQARVLRHGSAVFIRDLGGKNGTWIGETRAEPGRDTPWRPALMVRVGRTVLAIEEPVSGALAEIEAAPDERMAEPPAPPPSPVEPVAPAAAAPRPTNGARAGSGARSLANRWSIADFAVMTAALAILALSLGGLAWLLRAH